jgi:chemotaxis protein methyltransferase CheR
MSDSLTNQQLHEVSDFVAQTLGLDFPPQRWPDLRRGLATAARQLGLPSSSDFAHGLLNPRPNLLWIDTLAGALTVGETYFFRDTRSFTTLEEFICSAILHARRGSPRRLRIWSAACCTGEEPYSIAILLRRLIPDLNQWDITILATDINQRFLQKATHGIFSSWSFRQTPAWLKTCFFNPVDRGQFEILPEIRRMVRFDRLNLADDIYPSPANNTHAMDVIFCRNVLMYFTPTQAKKVVQRLHRALSPNGLLLVAPGELPHTDLYPQKPTDGHPSGHFEYQIDSIPTNTLAPVMTPARIVVDTPPREKATIPSESAPAAEGADTAQGDHARFLANQGKLDEALDYCERWIKSDQFNSAGHYLRGMILDALGATDSAIRALRAALYLNPSFVMAHFQLSTISHRRGGATQALRHLEIARRLLHQYQPHEVLPESEGVTAARFTQIVDSLLRREAA